MLKKSTQVSRFSLGPGFLIAAAFIGPGTVITTSMAGATFGYTLLWALLFSVITTIVLQEMSARLGIVTRAGLSEALRNSIKNPLFRYIVLITIVTTITLGSLAFEAGNIIGAASGLSMLFPVNFKLLTIVIASLAFVLLATGSYQSIQTILIGLVALMSLAFVCTLVLSKPDLIAIGRALIFPQIPAGSLLIILALIGTIITPYNLFLHANIVSKKWGAQIPLEKSLPAARRDTFITIGIGGFISCAVLLTAVPLYFSQQNIENIPQLATELEPLLGSAAKYLLGIGLFAAGITSAVTAPLATAFACCGAIGWPVDLKDWRFRSIWMSLIIIGLAFALQDYRPLQIILIAQATNGVLLPLIALALLWLANREKLLHHYRNGKIANILGCSAILITTILAVWKIKTLIF